MDRIDELLNDAWAMYDLSQTHVLKPSLPILWFGDLEAYLQSDLRIITVGLNPSAEEFTSGFSGAGNDVDAWSYRFPAARKVHSLVGSEKRQVVRTALNKYFVEQPYGWFSGFERVLNGMDATYGYRDEPEDTDEASAPLQQRIALHTDLCLPLATAPTWSKLEKSDQRRLVKTGAPLWNSLVQALVPDIIIMAIGEEWIQYVELDPDDESFEIGPKADAYWTRLPNAKSTTLVIRAPHILPSAYQISHSDKQLLGEKAFRIFRTQHNSPISS